MIIDELKKANIEALKNKDKDGRAVLSVVINKYMLSFYEKKAKNQEMSDADTISIIQKTIKELAEEKEGYAKVGNEERVKSIEAQENTLKRFMPTFLSEEEIRKIVSSLEDKSIPSVMKYFKEHYAGKVDMSLVSKITREF